MKKADYIKPKQAKKIAYCTYHSCIITSAMMARRDCFHKSNTGNVQPCRYMITLFDNSRKEKR